ncbi:MAG: SDR family NAD(P)-dependent oxidoreductase, partial [Phycisphaerales bacterium]
MTIDGKVALVTGGSGGLGSVHCLTLAKIGCNVAVAGYTHMDKAEDVAKNIQNLGRNAIAIKMDVSKLDDVQRGVKQIEEALGPVEILVNNAASGIVRAATIVNTEKKDWDRDLSVNLTGAFNTIKCCMPGMVERGWGRIINISSITGTQGGMGQCSYAATKAGLIGLMRTAALEGARKGVTCNALVLGVFDAGGFHEVAPEFQERIIKRMAMRRMGDPQEVSNVLAFLVS